MNEMRQVPLVFGPPPSMRFDNFVAGTNLQALETLRAPLAATPVYLWGPPGSGKTHLLQALATEVQAAGGRVAAFGMHDAPPWTFDEDLRLVVLDDVGRYDAAQQHAAFTLFVQTAEERVALVAAGRLPPVDLPIRDDLRTRLGWGLVFQMQPPAEDHVRALLRREADRRGILLTDDVMDYLLNRYTRDLSHLMATLDRLDRYSLTYKKAVTVALLRRMHDEEKLP